MSVVSQISRERLLATARSLPAEVQVLSRLGEMLQDVNSELDEISDLLRRDVALAARIVRIANSPMFGGGVSSVEEAVNRVGFGEILKLVGTASAARLTEHALDTYGISAQKLRNNMLYGAFASEALARLSGADARSAYLAGLLRPLGMMVLDRAARATGARPVRFAHEQWPTYSAWEGGMFGVDNCEVASLILDEWRFPKAVGAGIRTHYLSRPEDLQQPLAALLNVSNGLASRVSRSFVGETRWWDITDEKLAAAGLTVDDFEPAIIQTEAAFDAANAALRGSEKIFTTARLLPAAPQVMAGLCELLHDDNSDLAQVAEQIRVDAALSARVLRIANGPTFGGATRVGSVDEAVSRVGFGEILRLVGLATVAGLADRKLAFYGIAAEHLRESLLLHGLAAEALARHAGLDARTAYAGGLLRALGLMVLDRVARDREPAPEPFDARHFPHHAAWEEAMFGLTSVEVTTTLLDEWRFAPELVDALDRHALSVDESHEDRLAVALNLAGAIVAAAGLALPGEADAWTPTPRKFAALQLDPVQWAELQERRPRLSRAGGLRNPEGFAWFQPVTMFRLPLLLLLVVCPLGRAAVPQLLQDAIAKLAKDTDRWAYTQTTIQKDDKGKPKSEIVLRFDPSKPYAEQYQLLKIDGKEPSESQQKKYRRMGEKRGDRIDKAEATGTTPPSERKSLGELMDLERASVLEENDKAVTYEVPLRKEGNTRFPPEKFTVTARVNKEQAAFETDKRITNSEGAGVSAQQSHFFSAHTHGFRGGYASSRHSISVAPIAGKGDGMQRDAWYTSMRYPQDLAEPEAVGRYAAERALSRLKSRKIATTECPVLLESPLAAGLLGAFVQAISGGALYRKSSFLLDSLGKRVLPAHIDIFEDPFVKRGKGSSPFDDEGVRVKPRQVVEAGRVQGYFLSSYSARKLGMKTTGNAGGSHNLTLHSRKTRPGDSLE
eukprot:gene34979-45270_t